MAWRQHHKNSAICSFRILKIFTPANGQSILFDFSKFVQPRSALFVMCERIRKYKQKWISEPPITIQPHANDSDQTQLPDFGVKFCLKTYKHAPGLINLMYVFAITASITKCDNFGAHGIHINKNEFYELAELRTFSFCLDNDMLKKNAISYLKLCKAMVPMYAKRDFERPKYQSATTRRQEALVEANLTRLASITNEIATIITFYKIYLKNNPENKVKDPRYVIYKDLLKTIQEDIFTAQCLITHPLLTLPEMGMPFVQTNHFHWDLLNTNTKLLIAFRDFRLIQRHIPFVMGTSANPLLTRMTETKTLVSLAKALYLNLQCILYPFSTIHKRPRDECPSLARDPASFFMARDFTPQFCNVANWFRFCCDWITYSSQYALDWRDSVGVDKYIIDRNPKKCEQILRDNALLALLTTSFERRMTNKCSTASLGDVDTQEYFIDGNIINPVDLYLIDKEYEFVNMTTPTHVSSGVAEELLQHHFLREVDIIHKNTFSIYTKVTCLEKDYFYASNTVAMIDRLYAKHMKIDDPLDFVGQYYENYGKILLDSDENGGDLHHSDQDCFMLYPKQFEAYRKILENPITIITGYAGSGKTYLIEALVASTGGCDQAKDGILVATLSADMADELSKRIGTTCYTVNALIEAMGRMHECFDFEMSKTNNNDGPIDEPTIHYTDCVNQPHPAAYEGLSRYMAKVTSDRANIEASSQYSQLRYRIRHAHTLVIDEFTNLSEELLGRLFALPDTDTDQIMYFKNLQRLVMTGDEEQIWPISRGEGGISLLTHFRKLSHVFLDQNVRSKEVPVFFANDQHVIQGNIDAISDFKETLPIFDCLPTDITPEMPSGMWWIQRSITISSREGEMLLDQIMHSSNCDISRPKSIPRFIVFTNSARIVLNKRVMVYIDRMAQAQNSKHIPFLYKNLPFAANRNIKFAAGLYPAQYVDFGLSNPDNANNGDREESGPVYAKTSNTKNGKVHYVNRIYIYNTRFRFAKEEENIYYGDVRLEKEDLLVVVVTTEEELFCFSKHFRSQAPFLEPVYARTVNTQQGREADMVVLWINGEEAHGKTARFVTRNHLHVAFSRARKCFYCVGTKESLEIFAKRQDSRARLSVLAVMLHNKRQQLDEENGKHPEPVEEGGESREVDENREVDEMEIDYGACGMDGGGKKDEQETHGPQPMMITNNPPSAPCGTLEYVINNRRFWKK